jgi:hypothetical protein
MTDLADQLRAFVASSPELVQVLRAVRELGPEGAYVAAGAIRDTVWNTLTGRPPTVVDLGSSRVIPC